ncbi:MAG: hypothetical protein PHC62_06885 [Candidatus Izemoplasmatales bacterium]|nr:hypothetical protein [Candidatus Izemoplasmatales bacterium]
MGKFKIGDVVIRTNGVNKGQLATVKRIENQYRSVGIEFFEPIGLHDFNNEPRGKPKHCFWSDPSYLKIVSKHAEYETIE